MRLAVVLALALVALASSPYRAHAQSTFTYCSRQTQQQLLAEFADNVAPAAITPATIRNLICSEPPNWATLTRPIPPVNGMLGFNTDLGALEWFKDGTWYQVPTSVGGTPCTAFGSTTGTCYEGSGGPIGGNVQVQGTLSVGAASPAAAVLRQNSSRPTQLDVTQQGNVTVSLGNLVAINNNGNPTLAQSYLGSPDYNNGPGLTLNPGARVQANGMVRGWERQSCVASFQSNPPAENTNGCGQGNFYSFPYRYVYHGQDTEAITGLAFGVPPVATGVGISSVTPTLITNAASQTQQVYKVNFSTPLNAGQISQLQALSGSSTSLPIRVETNNFFNAYILPGTWPLAGGGTIPSVDPSGNFLVVDCFTRPRPFVPDGPDPTAPISPAPPTNNNACPLPTDFGYGFIRLPTTDETPNGDPTLHFQTNTSRLGYGTVVAGLNVTGDGVATSTTTTTPLDSTTATMTNNATAKIYPGAQITFTGQTVRTYATAPVASGNVLPVAATTENLSYIVGTIVNGWHVWGYGIPYGTTVTGVVGSNVSISNNVLPGGVAMGGATCTNGILGRPGPGCLTFSAPDATTAGLTLQIDTVHVADGLYVGSVITDEDTLHGSGSIELININAMTQPPAWAIDPLNDEPLTGGIYAGVAGQPIGFGLFVTQGHKRGVVLDNASEAGTGPTYGIYAESPDVALYSRQPTGKYVIIVNKDGTSANNSVAMTTDGDLNLARNLVAHAADIGDFITLTVSSTVAGLPTCDSSITGQIRYVSDASAPTWNAPLSGSGAVRVLALCNGTDWTAH